MTATVSGVRELKRRLDRLEKKDAKRIGRKAINRGLTIVARGVRAKAPGRRIKKVVGKRNKRNRRKGIQEAKAGVGVAKKRDFSKSTAPHAHLVAAGTANRKTTGRGRYRSGANRGRVKRNNFVARGARSRQSQAAAEMMKTIKLQLRTLRK